MNWRLAAGHMVKRQKKTKKGLGQNQLCFICPVDSFCKFSNTLKAQMNKTQHENPKRRNVTQQRDNLLQSIFNERVVQVKVNTASHFSFSLLVRLHRLITQSPSQLCLQLQPWCSFTWEKPGKEKKEEAQSVFEARVWNVTRLHIIQNSWQVPACLGLVLETNTGTEW